MAPKLASREYEVLAPGSAVQRKSFIPDIFDTKFCIKNIGTFFTFIAIESLVSVANDPHL